MAVDLKLINELWFAAQAVQDKEHMSFPLDYATTLMVGIALFEDKELAQKFVDGTWEEGG